MDVRDGRCGPQRGVRRLLGDRCKHTDPLLQLRLRRAIDCDGLVGVSPCCMGVRMAWSPTNLRERIVVTQSDDGYLDAYVCTPTCTVTNNIGQVWSSAPSQPQKRFDIAYEGSSGDALLVYGVLSTDTTRDIAY